LPGERVRSPLSRSIFSSRFSQIESVRLAVGLTLSSDNIRRRFPALRFFWQFPPP
jgi:hypothetical protein